MTPWTWPPCRVISGNTGSRGRRPTNLLTNARRVIIKGAKTKKVKVDRVTQSLEPPKSVNVRLKTIKTIIVIQ